MAPPDGRSGLNSRAGHRVRRVHAGRQPLEFCTDDCGLFRSKHEPLAQPLRFSHAGLQYRIQVGLFRVRLLIQIFIWLFGAGHHFHERRCDLCSGAD